MSPLIRVLGESTLYLAKERKGPYSASLENGQCAVDSALVLSLAHFCSWVCATVFVS